jgi:hypothetical protein
MLLLLLLLLQSGSVDGADGTCLGWAARDSSGVLAPYKFSRRELQPNDVTIKITHAGEREGLVAAAAAAAAAARIVVISLGLQSNDVTIKITHAGDKKFIVQLRKI